MKKKLDSIVALLKINRGVGAVMGRQELDRVMRDLCERPTLKNARTLTMTFTFTPLADPRGILEEVKVSIEANSRTPKMKTRDYSMGVEGDKLIFNDESPEDVKQGTLDEIER